MLAIIVGSNRVEVCPLKKADYEKWFFRHRGQTYLIMPQNLVRLRYYDHEGREYREPEEAIFFPEGSSLAYDTAPECVSAYYQENVLPAIELAKAVKKNRWKAAGFLKSAQDTMRALYPIAGILITAVIVGYALLTGGA